MRYRVVEKEEFRVVGKKARVPLVYLGVNPAIADFIRSIGQDEVQRIAALSDQKPDGIVSATVTLDECRAEGSELDYYHAVVTGTASPAPEGLDTLTVPAGTWAVFEHSGPFPESLQHLWGDVFAQWFPSNPYRSRPGPEILRTRPTADGTHADCELWIPVDRTA